MANREKKLVKEDFDKIDNYDANRDMYYFKRRRDRLISLLPEDESINILDFGGGSGLFSLELIKRGYKNVYLVDLSETQIRQAREKGLKNLFCGDENTMPFKADFFDFVFMADVIEHLEDPYKTLMKIRRVMKPGAMLYITYPNPLWVPILNVLGEIGLKLKGKDNKIYLSRLRRQLSRYFYFRIHEGHMFASKLPNSLLRILERTERVVPQHIKRQLCILNIAVLIKRE